MTQLIINGIPVTVPAGTTVLEAAAGLGIRIPTLCHERGRRPLTSCMLCTVEDVSKNRFVPACAAPAEEGMIVETDSDKVRHARRSVLEMLLSEHVGDCEAPCERACHAGLNVPLMLRHVAQGRDDAARALAREALVLPAVLGRICTAPCEAVCRRGFYDEPLAIREIHGQLAVLPGEPDQTRGDDSLRRESGMVSPDLKEVKQVSVIGSGPAGLAAAFVLRRYGHSCRVYEKRPQAGGSLLDVPEQQLPRAVLEGDLNYLAGLGIAFVLDTGVGAAVSLEDVLECSDAVVVACKLAVPEQAGVFRAEEHRMPVRSVALGKRAAEAAHAWLAQMHAEASPVYHSTIGRISREMMRPFVDNRATAEALRRSRDVSRPEEEAERCLHCDCHAPVSCKLRHYAAEYGARQGVFRSAERPLPGGILRYGDVIFDAGKCIKCGLCVDVAQEMGEPFGLTFTGRGFTMEVTTPFGESLEKSLAKSAPDCVAVCPTGALAFDTKEERL